MPDSLSFEIITPEGLQFQDDVYQVSLPTPEGYIGILPHHIPLVSVIAPGVISIRRHKDEALEETEYLACTGGFCDIDGRRVRLLADTAERAEDIDEAKAQEALARAKQLRIEAKDAITLEQAVRLIEAETARFKTAQFKRRWRKSTTS